MVEQRNLQQKTQQYIDAAVQAARAAIQEQMQLQNVQNIEQQQPLGVPLPVPPGPQVNQFAYALVGTFGPAANLFDYHTPNGAKIQKSAFKNLMYNMTSLDAENLNDFLGIISNKSYCTRLVLYSFVG